MPALTTVVLRNWPLKMAALVLSLMVWVIIASEEKSFVNAWYPSSLCGYN